MDGYLGNYKQKFQDFKNYITEVFKMTNEFKYMKNPNNLSAKLSSHPESEKTLNHIKKSIITACKVKEKYDNYKKTINL